ncbi:MAG: site-specific integrase [Lachnospiraceae bacterium]|nr:site-specific integrase [Lachnospiraceae bacterium]
MTEQEQVRFVKALMEHSVPVNRNSYKLQLLIELYSGMRMGEINALRPGDIDFENGFIHVSSTVSRGINYRPYIKEGTKTEAGVRDIPISGLLKPVLLQALDAMEENPEGLIFYDHNKDSLVETTQVNCFFKRICQKADIPVTGQHALRHTFATRCIEAGISPLVLKTWLGHTNIHITLDTYADVFARMNAGAVSLLEQHIEAISPVMLPEGDEEENE